MFHCYFSLIFFHFFFLKKLDRNHCENQVGILLCQAQATAARLSPFNWRISDEPESWDFFVFHYVSLFTLTNGDVSRKTFYHPYFFQGTSTAQLNHFLFRHTDLCSAKEKVLTIFSKSKCTEYPTYRKSSCICRHCV